MSGGATSGPDPRALKILRDTYWSPTGWRSSGPDWRPDSPAADLEYARRAGVMFEPRRMSHDQAVDAVVDLRERITPHRAGAAFLASLGTRASQAPRSALGSLAVALHLWRHKKLSARGSLDCAVCGALDTREAHDLDVLNFERHQWGGVRHGDPVYAAFDLERFLAEPAPRPDEGDRARLRAMLDVASELLPGAKLADLVRAWRPYLPGNDAQRRTVVGILGYAGVLRPRGKPGFLHAYTPQSERTDTPWPKDDWPYPVGWWRGGDPIDAEAVAFWFEPL